MAIDNNLTTGLKMSLSMAGGNRQPLKFGSPLFASHKQYQIYTLNRNILAKATQLVNDLEDARAARITLDNFLSGKNSSAPSARGSLFDSGI